MGRSELKAATLLFLSLAVNSLVAQQVAIGSYATAPEHSGPWAITAGPDGALWFTEADNTSVIGRLTPAGEFTGYTIPTPGSSPYGIVTGPDGALWFAEAGGNRIGRLTTAGVFTEYPVPTADSAPAGITVGPDGALWFAELNGNRIGRIAVGGAVAEYPVPTAASAPDWIAAGPDGALWFTELSGGHIGRITTGGAVTEYPIPTPDSQPEGIAAGPDGALWFAEYAGGNIGRITTDGVITEYPVSKGLSGIANGPDGALWFTNYAHNKIGRISTSGEATEYDLPNEGSVPIGIVTGPDGNIWFADYSINRVGEALFVSADLSITPAQGGYKSDVTFSGSGYLPDENVQIYAGGIGSKILATVAADGAGTFSVKGTVPESVFGPRIFLAVGAASEKLGAASFIVTPRLVMSPDAGAPGTSTAAGGYGFPPYAYVNIYWNTPRMLVSGAVADYQGSFTGSAAYPFVVPDGALRGLNLLFGEVFDFDKKPVGIGYFTVE